MQLELPQSTARVTNVQKLVTGRKQDNLSVSDERRLPALRKLQVIIHHNPTAVPLIIMCISIILFGLLVGERFLSVFNLTLVVKQVSIIAIIGIAQTLIVLTAGIDLSIGAILVLSHVITAKLATTYGFSPPVAIGIGMVTGMTCGLLNGCLVAVFKLPPFIATLGTWAIFGALILWYSGGETIGASQIQESAPYLQYLGNDVVILGARLSYGLLLVLLVSVAVWLMLTKTALGRHIYATGDNEEAARFAGINTSGTIIFVYTVSGLIAAIGGLVLIGRLGVASPLAGGTLNIDSITAVVIGGASLFGGRGALPGTLLGAFIVGMFRNGLALSGVDVVWQEFSVGILILLAVAIDQWIRKVAS